MSTRETSWLTDLHSETATLLDLCCELVCRYVVLTPKQLTVLAVWILHTWAIEAADFTPYLHITAPEKGSGKSRLLETLGIVVRQPERTGGMSAAALMRTVNAEAPTLLLDEVDATFKGNRDVAEALRGMLDEGFRRDGNIRRCKPPQWEVQVFRVFGAKALAGIGKVPDTVASRSITIEMRRKTKAEKVENFRIRDATLAAIPLRKRLLAWSNPGALEILYATRPILPDGLSDRQADVSEPLLAIADLAGGSWPATVRESLAVLFGSAVSEDSSLGVTLLRDIRTIFGTQSGRDAGKIYSAQLASALREIEGAPWSEWDHGRGLNANSLAKRLKPYHIHPQSVRTLDGTGKGYKREDFSDVWERYLPPMPEEPFAGVTAVTTAVDIGNYSPFASDTTRFGAANPSNEKPRQSSVVTPVTDTAPIKGKQEAPESKRFISGVL